MKILKNRCVLKVYTVSRNGRLNTWECDTKLKDLVRSNKAEKYAEALIGTDSDELSNTKIKNDFEDVLRKEKDGIDDMEIGDDEEKNGDASQIDDENVKITIKYKKAAK